jgi:KaiC/GvpD/RAD55 family RecA-like ATPase
MGMSAAGDLPDLAPHIGEIARWVLGEPNRQLSNRAQLRFGHNGSVAVEIAGANRGQWYDHEAEIGGDALGLLREKGGLPNGKILDWLRDHGIPVDDRRRREVAVYAYHDEQGAVLYEAVRFEPKGFAQRRPNGVWKLGDVRRVPYRLPELLATPTDATVYVPEGEKDVERLRRLGLVAVCNSEGAGKWRSGFADYFRGRDVVILPDNDEAGHKHAAQVFANLMPVARRVRIVELPGLQSKGDVSDWLDAGGSLEELRRLVDAADPPPSAASTPLALWHFEAMRPRLDDGYLIKGLLGASTMAVLYGEAGCGKTFLAVHIGLRVAAGAECFGRRVRRTGVIYVAAEAGRGIANRIAAAKHETEFPETMPFAAITAPVDLRSDDADIEPLIATVIGANLGEPVGLIIIDTLSRVMAGGNENGSDDMGALVQHIDRLRAETGATTLLVHHSGKEASRGARGHSLLRAATDTEIEVSRDDASKTTTALVMKQRDLATAGALIFKLRQVALGMDQDGDPIASCVVDELPEEPATAPAPRRLSPQQSRALQVLAEAIDTGGQLPPPSNHIPNNMRCTTLETWRAYADKRAVSIGGESARRMAFNRASQALVDAGHVAAWDPWVWICSR